jgi:hypothetical protein
MKRLFLTLPLLAIVVALSGCGGAGAAFPLTSNGYEQGGIVGAVSGFNIGVQAVCRQLDSEETVAAANLSAGDFGAAKDLEKIRVRRRSICLSVGTVGLLVDGVIVPLTAGAPSPLTPSAPSAAPPAEVE